jgi:muconolactone delta-isomerase
MNIQFMVDFTMPKQLPEEFMEKVPRQRALVNQMMSSGTLLSYALSLESGKLWAIFSVPSEAELMELVYSLPLTDYMQVRVAELDFYNRSQPFAATFSVN